MKKKEKKQQGTKKQGEKQSHLLVWIAAAVILIPRAGRRQPFFRE